MKLKLNLPFNGYFPVTFPFDAIPEDKEIKKKFHEWGISGHHGADLHNGYLGFIDPSPYFGMSK